MKNLVYHATDKKSPAFIKWEGYTTQDSEFHVCYFDCIFHYTRWLEDKKPYHTGNVTYVTEDEYDKVYMKYHGLVGW